MFIIKALRTVCGAIDYAVYTFVDWLYQLFMMLAETGIFSGDSIREFSQRIYFFLGLLMVFKVSISIVQYILNPDAVNDKKIGASKLLTNIVFILLGIVAIPYIFDAAYGLQRIILRDNVVGSLVLGMDYKEGNDASSYIKNAGDRMTFATYTAFFNFNTDIISEECSRNPVIVDESGNISLSDACMNDPNAAEIEEFYNSYTGGQFAEAYRDMDYHKLMHYSIHNETIKTADGEEEFLFSYALFITTAAGAFLAYVLLVFCFDVAVRSVKLGFLQLIAPIPLISKIDPKKGDEVFGKWVKECT